MSAQRWAAVLALLGAPSPALSGPPGEVDLLIQVLAEDPGTVELGATVGPPESRATWLSLGAIRPFEGSGMLVFSTGDLFGAPSPGTDLSAAGADDDRAGLQLTLRVPPDARSLRIAYALVALDNGPVDEARLVLQGDSIALDPWTLGPLRSDSAAVALGSAAALLGTPWAGQARASAWMEAVVAVAPGSQLALGVDVRDGGDDAGSDTLLLLDGLRFEQTAPIGARPGALPSISGLEPREIPPGTDDLELIVAGSGWGPDTVGALLDDGGNPVASLDSDRVDVRSAERLVLRLPPLPEGDYDLRLDSAGPDGAGSLLWPAALEVRTHRPRIHSVVPSVGPPDGGTTVVIRGEGFHGAVSVRMGDSPVAGLRRVDEGHLEVVTPTGSGPADVLVFAQDGASELADGFTYAEDAADPSSPPPPPPGGPSPACSAQPRGSGSVVALGLLLAVRRRRRA